MVINPGEIGTAAALALYITWREVVPRLLGNRNGARQYELRESHREWMESWMDKSLSPKFDQQIAIFEEIRGHMQKSNEALAVLLARK
jgi:hypothetical protein